MMIRERLLELQDEGYRDFMARLIPTADKAHIIGVRAPALKSLAASLWQEPAHAAAFLADLPHQYHEENLLHAVLLERIRDFDEALAATERLLPYVDNWAVSDSLAPAAFKKNKPALKRAIRRWLDAEHDYTVRFGIGMLMTHFLDTDFAPFYLDWTAAVRSDAYYVNMMVAWFFATALTKQYEHARVYLEDRRLPVWNHNKSIQKAIESRCIDDARKAYLRTLKIRAGAR